MAYQIVAAIRYRCIVCDGLLMKIQGGFKHHALKKCKDINRTDFPLLGVQYVNPLTQEKTFDLFKHYKSDGVSLCGAYIDISKKVLRRKRVKKDI